MMSHELRTPLNTINGFLEILLDGLAGPLSERQREFLAYAHTSTHRLIQLLEEMVLLSRPAQSHSLLYRAWTDPRGPIESARATHAETAQARGITLSCEIATELPPLWADAERLAQALAYLLGWALARTPPGGAVTLRAGPHAGGVAIVVEDRGPSLEDEALARLFEPSRPVPGSTTLPPMTGLELAVARRIITLHEGELRASQRPEGGIQFYCALPGPQDAAPETTTQHGDPP